MSESILIEAVPQCDTAAQPQRRMPPWMGWAPLVVLPLTAIALRESVLPWVFMWMLAIAIFAGCKWQTWWEARSANGFSQDWKCSLAYLLLWPGMDAREFFDDVSDEREVPQREWFAASGKTLAGIVLIWCGARLIALNFLSLGGWASLVGLVLVLHFGMFQLLALAWQRAGIRVTPIMQKPLLSPSLSDLWGKRWNLGYRDLSYKWIFKPVQKRFGGAAATVAAFLVSGFIHDLVISVPARGGYGLPTAYFLLQGLGSLAERTATGKWLGMGRGVTGWLWTAAIALGPVYILFHPPFVMRVMVPFLRALSG
jgi:Membrane bound O-acyl transferase family